MTLFPPFYSDFGKNSTFGKNVFINSGCKFSDQNGIVIGDNTVVGAASVGTKDVPANTVIVGSPAWVVRMLEGSETSTESRCRPDCSHGIDKFLGDPTGTSSYARMTHVKGLHIPPGPGAPRGLYVPPGELVEQFSHASGPGGQGVNTTDSRVQLRIDLGATTALSEAQRELVLTRLSTRLSGTLLTITASEHRSQKHNRVAARQRLSALLRESLVPPLVRRPTKPTRGSQRRRLESKRARSEIKQSRRRPNLD